MNRPAFFLTVATLLAGGALAGAAVKPEALMAEAAELQQRGESSEAFKKWEKAGELFAKKKDDAGEFDALLRQIAACQALGQQKIALAKLDRMDALAGKDQHRMAAAKGARGAVSMYARQAGAAEDLLKESAKLARATHDDALAAAAQHNLGLMLAGTGQAPQALNALEEALRLAKNSGDTVLAARVRKAITDAHLAAAGYPEAKTAANEAIEAAQALPDSHEKAFLLMSGATALDHIAREADEHDNALRLRAFTLHAEAAAIAARIADPVAQSYALGYQGGLYEFEGKLPEALALTHRALALAQQAQAPDSVYRWQWQAARILAKQGDRDAAIEGYRRAVATLQGVRNDVAIRFGNRNAGSSFREVVGNLYVELAGLLLQRADTVTDDAERQKLFREARGTSELLKSAELEDYFQDDCVSLRKSLTKSVENIDEHAAVIYVIALADHSEILVSLPTSGPVKAGEAAPPGRIERFKTTPNDELLMNTARDFRTNVEDRTSFTYLEQAQQLYTWLIKPVEGLLAEHHFTTLVFVPDGALRTVPMAALHDGKQFLIEKYAVAVTPGLELMEAKKPTEVLSRMLVSGLTDSVQGFSALPAVSAELDRVTKIYHGANTLKDKQFSTQAVSDQLKQQDYSIVHLATHGVFNSDVRKSFVLTHDNQLTLDDLERLIRPGQLRDHPLELLTLSACETAAGDDRAALGLAGVAVKAGARSAFASLWAVNDRASASLIADFYTELQKPGRNKAQALQTAQRNLFKDPRFEHPCYWAPYLIIGNWL